MWNRFNTNFRLGEYANLTQQQLDLTLDKLTLYGRWLMAYPWDWEPRRFVV